MDVLFVSVQTPGPADLRTMQMIRRLCARGHAVTLVCGATPRDTASIHELRGLGVAVQPVPLPSTALRTALRVASTALPFATGAALTPHLIAAVQEAARNLPNAVAHVVGLAAAPLGMALRRLPAVLDLGQCASFAHLRTLRGALPAERSSGASLRQRIGALCELGRTRRYEAQLGAQFERLIAATPTDAWAVRTLAEAYGASRQTPIRVLPDGVDLQAYAPQPMLREPLRLAVGRLPAREAAAALQFIAAELMPRLWQAHADIQLTLVDVPLNPVARRLAHDPRVTLLPATADTRPALSTATIAVVPPLPGLPPALLEALALGAPVVAGAQLAGETHLRDGYDLLLAADGAAYAQAVLALFDDPGYRGRLGRAGRRYVEQHHNWDDVAAEVEQIYAAALGAEIADWRLDMGFHRRMPASDYSL